MSTLWQDIQYKMLRSDSRLNLVIGINVAAFLLASIPAIAVLANQYILLSPVLADLARHVWTPFTYMFMHDGFFATLFNMLWLYWIGRVFEEYLNFKRFIGLYIIAGLTGAILYIALYNLLPFAHVVMPAGLIAGATVSVMAIMVATATLLPDFELQLIIIGRVKLRWVCVFYVTLALLGAKDSPGSLVALVGGALIGFVYIKQLQRGNDWIGTVNKWFTRTKPQMQVVTHNQQQKRSSGKPNQEEIDRILDKISGTGYDSLSKQEKETLFRASNNNES